MGKAKPKFLADEMLGRLAKWLRILGYDTRYVSRIPDLELLELAEAEERSVLTRDTLLIRRRRCSNYIFIRSDYWREQLKQVYAEAGLDCESLFTICPVCNGSLFPVEKKSVRSLVPVYVYETEREFSRCEGCLRVFWPATHVSRILEELENVRKGS